MGIRSFAAARLNVEALGPDPSDHAGPIEPRRDRDRNARRNVMAPLPGELHLVYWWRTQKTRHEPARRLLVARPRRTHLLEHARHHDYDLLIVTAGFVDNPALSVDNPTIVASAVTTTVGPGWHDRTSAAARLLDIGRW